MTDENSTPPNASLPPLLDAVPDVSPATVPDIIPATKRGLWTSIALIVFCAALLVFFQWLVFPLIESAFGAAPPPHATSLIKGIFISTMVLGMVCAIAVIRSGWKSLRCGYYPPPGAWVWRDTKVRQGRAAIFIAWSCILFGVFAGILCVGVGAYTWKKFERSMSPPVPSVGAPIPQGKPATTVK